MKGWANDFVDEEGNEWYFPMNSTDDVLEKIEELKKNGVEITEIYFYDHGACYNYGSYQVYAIEFGDDEVKISARSKFWEELGKAADGCVLNFRCCLAGNRITALAYYTGQTVTACKGLIRDKPAIGEGEGPDYSFEGDLVMASYDNNGILKTQTLWQHTIKEVLMYEPYVYVVDGYATYIYVPIYITYDNPQEYEGY